MEVSLNITGPQNTKSAGNDTLINIAEGLEGSDYNDRLRGDDAANTLNGNAGDDILKAV